MQAIAYIVNMAINSGSPKTAIGQRVAAYRKLRGFATPAALAAAIPNNFVSRSTIINIEAGRKVDPSGRDILGIAFGLQMSPLALLLDLDHPFEAASVSGDLLPGHWSEILQVDLLMEMGMSGKVRGSSSDVLNEPLYKASLARDIVEYMARVRAIEREIRQLEGQVANQSNEAVVARVRARINDLNQSRRANVELADVLMRTAPLSGIHIPTDMSVIDDLVDRMAEPNRPVDVSLSEFSRMVRDEPPA